MSKYNKIEIYTAKLLSNLPWVKNFVKRSYQILNYYLYKENKTFTSNFNVECMNTDISVESFFGYYDKCPDNSLGTYSIFQKVDHFQTSKKPSSEYEVSIVLKNNSKNEEYIIHKTSAYNWQQGTKLQWISEDKFIFNDYDKQNDKFRAIIYNLSKKEYTYIDDPIYDTHNEAFALTLSFERLHLLRPDYGYRNKDIKLSDMNYTDDGIFHIDFSLNEKTLLISLDSLIKLNPTVSMENATHKVNHIMISPVGDKFMFMHRWLSKNGKRYDRLLVSDIKGKEIKVIADDGMVSHCCWVDNTTIIGYFSHPSHNASFYKINIESNQTTLLSKSLEGFGDGHPTV